MSDKAYRDQCIIDRARHRIDPSRELPDSECWVDNSGQGLMDPDVTATAMLRGNAAAQEQLSRGRPTNLQHASALSASAGLRLSDWQEQMGVVTEQLSDAYEAAYGKHAEVASKLGAPPLVGQEAMSLLLTFLGGAFGNAVKVAAASKFSADAAAGLGALAKSSVTGLDEETPGSDPYSMNPAEDLREDRLQSVDASRWLQVYNSDIGQRRLPTSNPMQLVTSVLPPIPDVPDRIAMDIELELWKGWLSTSGWDIQYNAYGRSYDARPVMPAPVTHVGPVPLPMTYTPGNALRSRLNELGVDPDFFFTQYGRESCEAAQETVARNNWSLTGPDYDECE